ncbi:MAG: hypothetical protein EAZ09_23810 [Oscillatoriales cyanobacterium]|nr:MAG: hypothetical protein EAZ18_19190 [Oscillatoriales cyanobacterium]TAH15585.1 MAG: hypothetical protein EAZ09_23810 [Oscillatoriales cyanobacterium]
MSTLTQFVLLSTVLTAVIAFPQKPENSLILQNQFATSQQLLLAKDSNRESLCSDSSPHPGCSRRDNVTNMGHRELGMGNWA